MKSYNCQSSSSEKRKSWRPRELFGSHAEGSNLGLLPTPDGVVFLEFPMVAQAQVILTRKDAIDK